MLLGVTPWPELENIALKERNLNMLHMNVSKTLNNATGFLGLCLKFAKCFEELFHFLLQSGVPSISISTGSLYISHLDLSHTDPAPLLLQSWAQPCNFPLKYLVSLLQPGDREWDKHTVLRYAYLSIQCFSILFIAPTLHVFKLFQSLIKHTQFHSSACKRLGPEK